MTLISCGQPKDHSADPPATEIGVTALTATLKWQQGPGSEVVQCHTLTLPNDEALDVERIQFRFGAGSHHVHVYRSDTPEPDGVTDCEGGVAWPRWSLLIGSQTQPLDWALPTGTTMPIAPHQQLLVQVHWLNATSAPINEKIDIAFYPAESPGVSVGVLFGVNKRVALLPGEHKTIQQHCPMPSGSQVIATMGHFHSLGRRFSADVRANGADTAEQVIYSGTDEQTLLFKTFSPALEIAPDQGLSFECEFFNSRDKAADWGADTNSQEHCNLITYYTPADDNTRFCIQDFAASAPLNALTVDATRLVPVGKELTYTAKTNTPIAEDALIRLAVADPTTLGVPPFAVLLAGQTEIAFKAQALRPTRNAIMTASIGERSVAAAVGIGGLVLSELLPASPGSVSTSWLEIANMGSRPIDLSRYGIGAGGPNYANKVTALSGVIPPSGCMVLPITLPSGGDPPDGVGVGLFETTAGPIDAASVPLDAVVYGGANARGLMDGDGLPARAVAAPPPNQSLFRQAFGSGWIVGTIPTPGLCEVHW